jgi:hypothetical protein
LVRVRALVSLIAVGLAVGLVVTGCGGGGNQQDNQSQDSKAEQPKKERATKLESVEGIVVKSIPDKRTVFVKPDNGERQPFTYKPDEVKVTLDGKEAGPDAIDKGQRVSIGYKKVTTNKDREVNVARTIELQSKNGSPGAESTA